MVPLILYKQDDHFLKVVVLVENRVPSPTGIHLEGLEVVVEHVLLEVVVAVTQVSHFNLNTPEGL